MNKKIWVSNTSPIVFLTKIERLSLLFQMAEILIPEKVAEEIRRKNDVVSKELDLSVNQGYIKIKTVKKSLNLNIHEGEAEAISLAVQEKIKVILLDDQKARKESAKLSLSTIGTLGILLYAKKNGYLNNIKTEIDKLIKVDFRISDGVIIEVLKAANEN